MRKACKITAAARALAGEMVRPGVTTGEIDKAIHDYIISQGARPTFLHYNGFPASACISVNDVVIHGIPGGYVLKEGDFIHFDCTQPHTYLNRGKIMTEFTNIVYYIG